MTHFQAGTEIPDSLGEAGDTKVRSGLDVLRRLLAYQDVTGLVVSDDDPLKAVVEQVRNSNGEGRIIAFRTAMKDIPGSDDLIVRVLSGDPKEDAPQPRGLRRAVVHELPVEAQPDPRIAADTGKWLDSCVRYAQAVSPMTPSLFHESSALVLKATAIARRLVVQMPHGDVHPNLYVLEVAPSTIYAKSTGLNVFRRLAVDLMPHLLAPQESSPEALTSDMAGREPTHFDKLTREERVSWSAEQNYCAQRTLIVDEGSGLLALCAKDYGIGLTEFLLKLYDCDPWFKRSTRGQGHVTIRNAYLNLLTASTPSAMAPYLGPAKLWTDGLWPRFALLSPDGGRPPFQRSKPVGPPGSNITEPLARLYRRLPPQTYPEVVRPIAVTFDSAALRKWQSYDEALRYTLITDDMDERVSTSYGRMPTHVLKVATLLASMDWPEEASAPRIELAHLHRAIMIVESWRQSLHRVLDGGAVAEENVKLARVIRQVSLAGLEGITARDISRAMRDVPGSEVRKLLDQAISTEEIVIVQAERGPRGGQPGARYRILVE